MQKLFLGSIYRSPKGNNLNEFFTNLSRIFRLYDNIILADDLNSDLLSNDDYGTHLRKHIFKHSLYLVPFGATHHRDTTNTWLDVIFADSPTKIHSYVILTDSPTKVHSYEKSGVPFRICHYYSIVYKFYTPTNKLIYK